MFAELNGAKIFFDVAGLQWVPDGRTMKEKPVCLVFHGGPGASHIGYLSGMLPLAETMQLIFLDDRSCGLSERRDYSESTIEQNAADGEALRKYLGLDKIFVMGQSYGGMTAQRYALDYQENLYGAIFLCTAHNWPPRPSEREIVMERGSEEQKQMWINYENTGSFGDGIEWSYKMASLYNYRYDESVAAAAVDSYYRAKGWKNFDMADYQIRHGLADFEYIDELRSLKIPVSIFAGKQDFITSYEHSVEMHEAIPQSELHVMDQCSHMLFNDRPEYVFPQIEDFVKRNFKK